MRDGLPYPYIKKDAEEYIISMLSADKTKTFAFAITIDDKVVGSIGVFRCENIHLRTAELGYYIGEPYWGNGMGTSAVKQVCSYIFENTDIIRIFAEPFAYNKASCRVLEKAGFQFEGLLRNNAIKNGKVLDMRMYSLQSKLDKAFWARGYYVEIIGNITDEAVQKYIKEQAEESRKEDSRSTAL